MATPPYQPGDLVDILREGEGRRRARVSTVLPTESSLPDSRWMLTCRWVDDTGGLVDPPVHCGDDGVGRNVRPADGVLPGI